MSKHQEQIVAAAAGKLGEEIVSAAFAKPRGATTAAVGAGVITNEVGARKAGGQSARAGEAGIELANPGAVALTASSLVTMAVRVSFTGQIKEVTDVLSTVPLADVDSIGVKRMGLAGVMEITSRGSSFKLEGKVDEMRGLADAFERAKTAT